MAIAKRVLKRLYRTKAGRTHEAYQKYVGQEVAKRRKPMSFKLWAGTTSAVTKPAPKLRRRKPGTVKELRQARETARAKSRRK